MLHRRKRFACFFLLLLAVPRDADAQVLYGSVVGNVIDASQAPVPGATVVSVHKQTNQTRETTTGATGAYSFPTLPSGTYEIRITRQGFQTFFQSEIEVTINSVARVDAILQVGAVSESVTVTASQTAMQTDRSEVRQEMGSRSLLNLPVPPGRNYQNLFVTLPGFSPPANMYTIPSNPSRALTFQVNGAPRSSVNIRIEGASSTNIFLPHVAAYVPALESIETVNVVTNSFDAEQGLAGAAAINVQVKSGSNQVRGSAFWYHNDNATKAKPFFFPAGERNPKLVFNQFGASLGGPIKKDKLFYFASYEGTTDSRFASGFATVPTAAMKTGDLSDSSRPIYDPTTGDLAGFGRTPFPGNRIPTSRISPISRRIAGLTPAPTFGGEILQNNFFARTPFTFDRHTLDTKVNYNATDKLTTFVRLSILDYETFNTAVFGDVGGPTIAGGGSEGHGWGGTYSATLAATYVASPTLVLDAYYGYTLMDTNVEQPLLDQNIGRDVLGIPGTNGTRRFEGGWPRITISSFTNVGINWAWMPYYRHDPQYQYVGNVSWTKGAHNIRFGVDFYRQDLNHNQPEFPGAFHGASGGFTFAGGPTQVRNGPSANEYNSYGTFLLGLPTNYGRILQVPDEYTTRTWMYSGYVRDQWQVHRKLTVSYGTRYEFFPMPVRADRGVERYDFLDNKMLVCGIGGVPRDCGTSVTRRGFAPRLGFAYRPGDTWVIRAGYGLNWDPWNLARPLRTNYPLLLVENGVAPNAFQPVGRIENGIPILRPPDLGNGVIDIPLTYAVNSAGDRFVRSYIQSWNFTIQRQLGNWVAQAGYVATRQINQPGLLDLNVGRPGGGRASQPLNQRFGRTTRTALAAPIGHNHYNSLQTSLERRFSGGTQLNLAYTWSKSMGICCTDDGNGAPQIQLAEFYRLNRSLTGFDRPHNLQLTAVAELPFGRGKRWGSRSAIVSALAGGWQINGVMSYFSGTPFTVGADGASLDAPGNSQRADQVKPQVQKLGGVGRGQAFYDWTAFAPVTEARFGTAGFNLLRGPDSFNADLGLFRQFRVSERVKLQFRAEAFNFTNTPKFNNPSGNISNLRMRDGAFQGGVFEVTSTSGLGREGVDERVFRFGLRLSF